MTTTTANPGLRSIRLGGLAVLVALVAALLSTGSSDAAGVTVTIKNFQFTPTPVKVGVGGTVTWINRDIGDHKIIFNDGLYPASSLLSPGQRYTVKMTRAGTVNYSDGVAGFMTGTIFVTAAQVATAPPKVTPKPVRATPKPTTKPASKPAVTAKPTTKPATKAPASPATAAVVTESSGPSAPPAGAVTSTDAFPPDAAAISSSASGGDGGFPILQSLLVIGLVGLAFVGGIWVSKGRREPSRARRVQEMAFAPMTPPMTSPVVPTIEPAPRAPAPRAPIETKPRYPSDVDEDAPLESRRRSARPQGNTPADE